MKRAWSLCFVAGLAVALAVGVTAASAAPKRVDVVIKHAPEAVEKGTLPLASTTLPARAGGFQTLGRAATTASTAEVGDQKFFLGLDDFAFRVFIRNVHAARDRRAHRGLGADDIDFPRATAATAVRATTSPQPQVDSFIHEFDRNIYPEGVAGLQRAADRDGTNAMLPPPRPAGRLLRGDGDDIVTLVDNVRDDNFYDTDNAQ